jgi:ABC-type spermidine/putrescine transport system permease subunit I
VTAVRPLPPEAGAAGTNDRDERPVREGSVLWAVFTLPGSAWMVVFFLVPFYAVGAVAFGRIDPIFGTADPEWNLLQWDFTVASDTMQEVLTGPLRTVYLRTFLYVAVALLICVAIGYPVAYYVARRAGRTKTLLLVLLILPFWVNYLLRMLAWIGLLQPEGWVNDALVALGIFEAPRSWLSGNPTVVVIGLAYGYLPFFILPLYASLDRLDQRLIEAARDLGARPRQVFRRVTWPISLPGVVAATVLTALPMFGDYYTNSLMSGSPKTEMIGNQIQFYVQNSRQPQKGAVLVLTLSFLLALLCLWYVMAAGRARKLSRV